MWSTVRRQKIRKTFPTLAAAKTWRAAAQRDLRRRGALAKAGGTVRTLGEDLLTGMEDGSARNRSGRPYKPSVIRRYRGALNEHLLPQLGGIPLADLAPDDVQAFVDRLVAAGAQPSTVRNTLMPLRVIVRRHRRRLPADPLVGLELPASRRGPNRQPTTTGVGELLDALGAEDRRLWATAFYTGLRRGELMALEVRNLDLDQGVVRVERNYDPENGVFVDPKSYAAARRVPLPPSLAAELGSLPDRVLVFGRPDDQPFSDTAVTQRAHRRWRRAGLEPTTLHRARHTYAAMMVAAGVGPKALQTYMGHSSIQTTLDVYGHLWPGTEEHDAERLERWLENQ